MGASYLRLALLLPVICFPAVYTAPSHALPAGLQLQLYTQHNMSIGQSVLNLVNKLAADPDIRYNESKMLSCYIVIDNCREHTHDPWLSSHISKFRDITCTFRFGGPMADQRDSLFQVQNQYPLHWDQWLPPSEGFHFPYDVLPFSPRKAVGYMSAERADRLLKAQGWTGPYDQVSLGVGKTTAHSDGAWCFTNVQIPDGPLGQSTFLVDVRTARVEESQNCGF